MWSMIAGIIGGPFINGLLNAYKAKLAAGNTSETIAGQLAARELEVQQLEIQAQNQLKIAEVGHFWEPEKLFAYTILFYFGKVLIWDQCFGWGSTPEIHGVTANWAGVIMMFYFGKRGFENVARIIKR